MNLNEKYGLTSKTGEIIKTLYLSGYDSILEIMYRSNGGICVKLNYKSNGVPTFWAIELDSSQKDDIINFLTSLPKPITSKVVENA